MDRLEVGYVARAHGLKGEVRVHVHAPESTTLLQVKHVEIGGHAHVIVTARPANGAVLLMLRGVADRDAAEALRGRPVTVDRDVVTLEPGEYLLADLVGCTVFDEHGGEVGAIADLLVGPQPILVIHGGGLERLLPAVPQIVLEVDAQARRVVVALPEDLPAEPIR